LKSPLWIIIWLNEWFLTEVNSSLWIDEISKW
jgi:hypothetical protein